ncbi:hypothetical protein FBQ97_07835 [Acidobacteria bacterium ACD]|nr:MAG: hypothetical protein EDX89_00595 [Acidobacteriota bacterium]MDL1949707.1 hypothetical protein [Acidobacteria bacterium ACD]
MTRRPAGSLAVALLAAATVGGSRCGPVPDPAPPPLRLLLPGPPETLDPQRHHEDVTRGLLRSYYEGLVELDAELNLRPRLASDWSNPSETLWRFRLQEGVVFHDGSPFGAEDVARTLERARLPESKVDAVVRAIREVRVVDAATVELVTDRPRPLLLARLAQTPILPRGTPDAEVTVPVGTGPYRWNGRGEGPTSVATGTRFERYWGPRPDFEAFEAHASTDEAAVRRAASGFADVVSPFPRELREALPPGGLKTVSHPTVTVSFLVCRVGPLATGRPSPVGDARVRRAVDLAIDRGALVREALEGEAVPASQLVVPGVFGFEPALRTRLRDVAGARRLLAEAGLPSGLTLPIVVSPRGAAVAAVLSRQLAEAGLRLAVEPLDWTERYRRMRDAEAPLVLATWTTATGDASGLFEPLLHSSGGPEGFGSENTTGWSDPEADRWIREAASETDPAARADLLRAVMRRALRELPLVPLYSPQWTYGVRDGIGFTPRLDFSVAAPDVFRLGRQ